MGLKVIWSPRALDSLQEIVAHISKGNPAAAIRVGDRLIDKSLILSHFPELGAVFKDLGRMDVRDLAVPPYRLIYRVHADQERVTVLVAWHGARREPQFEANELNERASGYRAGSHFTAIAAMSLNRVIGNGSKIPWHLPDDFKWFKQTTMGQVLVMGRKTFESIGRPLPGRETIVLTRGNWSHPGVKTAPSLDQLPLAPDDARTVFIAGGAEIYRQALPLCTELLLTLVKREVEGDVIFPRFEDQFELVETIRETPEFDVLRFRQRKGA
jgi:dihydrofolate reductase